VNFVPLRLRHKVGLIIVIEQGYLMFVDKYWGKSDPGILTGRDLKHGGE